MSKLPSLLREYVADELRGVYTVSMVVVESVDDERRRCTVSFKRDENVLVDEVPIAATFASGDGYGEIAPIQQGDEGFVLHTKEPLDELLIQSGHREISYEQRQFAPQDAVFFPCVWNEKDTIPDHEPGEYLIAHADSVIRVKPDGTVSLADETGQQLRLDPETKETTVSHPSGQTIRLKSDGIELEGTVSIGDPAAAESVAVQDHTHDVTLSDGATATTQSPNEDGTDTELS
ncbi:hypothetical protein [Halorussus halophilus]|uniref:hypothetical protein n=1 Tax=Halorussus halophilus TaxID=2650975 RepID=UPI001300E4AD|nr:hypothetical protein [Halorussus halophilus]